MSKNMSRQKRQTNVSAELAKTVLLSFLALVVAVTIGHFATAEETLLAVTEKTIYAGDSVDISSCFSQGHKAENIACEVKEDGGDKDCVEVGKDGTVKGLGAGAVQVTVSYTLPESSVEKQELFAVKVLAPQEYSAVYGEVLPSMEAWNYYSQEKYEVVLSDDSLTYRENRICVEGWKDATVSLKSRDGKGDAFEVAKVTIQSPVFSSDRFARAVGTEAFAPEILHFQQTVPGMTYDQTTLEAGKIAWKFEETDKSQDGDQSGGNQNAGQSGENQSGGTQNDGQAASGQNSGDQSGGDQNNDQTGGSQQGSSGSTTDTSAVAKATEQGYLAEKVGSGKMIAVLTAKNGDQVSIEATLFVTDPVLEETQLVIAKGVTKSLVLLGTCEASTVVGAKTDLEEDEDLEEEEDLAYLTTGLNVYAAAKGTIDISIIVDGKVLTAHIIVTNPKFTSSSAIMYKKQSKTVKVSGINSTYSTVEFSSSNTKIATVSKKGVVKAKKSGRVRIYAKVDGKKIYVLVEISSKAGYKASKKAIAISKTKTKYSQWRRMSKGYYDCSSLVSRAYRPYGVYFGVKKGWSPTAAAIGKWCSRNKKVLSRKAVSYKKLLPGDIICYSYTRNGRYRNISHIEIYVGNGKNVSASSSNNRVIHYAYKNGSTVLVARPKK